MMSVFKLRVWVGIGFGYMQVKYRDYLETWMIFLFFRLRIRKKPNLNVI